MNSIMLTNAPLYFAVGLPVLVALVGILVSVTMFVFTNGRISRLEDRVHTSHDLPIGKMGEFDARLARLDERLST